MNESLPRAAVLSSSSIIIIHLVDSTRRMPAAMMLGPRLAGLLLPIPGSTATAIKGGIRSSAALPPWEGQNWECGSLGTVGAPALVALGGEGWGEVPHGCARSSRCRGWGRDVL